MQHLDLSQNAITDKGANAIANVFEECGTKMLATGSKKIEDDDQELMTQDTMMDNLEMVNVSYCRIQRHGLEALIKSSRLLQPCAKVYITGNFMTSVDDRDAIKFLIETMTPKKKNFGEEFMHRDRGHNNVSETIATGKTNTGIATVDDNVNMNPAGSTDDNTMGNVDEMMEFLGKEDITTEEINPNSSSSKSLPRRMSKKEKLKLEKRVRPPIGNKIVYGDRDLALPHICSGMYVIVVTYIFVLQISTYLSSPSFLNNLGNTELFQFPTIYEPKLKDDCEDWIRRSIETENMVDLKRGVEAAQRIGIHNNYNPALFQEAQRTLRAYEAKHIPM